MHLQGKLTTWNDERGFGFITPESGGKRVFVHTKSFKQRYRRPAHNQLVRYALSSDKQGRPYAVNVSLVGDNPPKAARQGNVVSAIITALLFFTVVGVSVLSGKTSPLVFVLYLLASLLTYIVYYFDKVAARKNAWRTQESTLHFMALIGGWPGALVAQQVLCHKSKKPSFRNVFWLTVLLNCVGFAWLFTAQGSAQFQAYISPVIYS